MRVLVTGGTGFVGRSVCERIHSGTGIEVFPVVRAPGDAVPGSQNLVVPDIGPETAWREILSGMDLVIHTAARVHATNDTAPEPCEFRRVNAAGTLNLARQAADAGVKRFVFLSSIKVNGNSTAFGQPFHADQHPAPGDAYGRSKYEAEVGLQRLSQTSGMEVVIIRPPLVYGPGVKANFLTMMRWVHRGWPVPFGNLDNRRSLVALDNLVHLIKTCCIHPAAANQVFLVSDDEDVATAELFRRIGAALQRPARFLPVPPGLVRMLAGIAGKRAQLARLTGSLQVDIDKTRRRLHWSPVVSMQPALEETARHYLHSLPR